MKKFASLLLLVGISFFLFASHQEVAEAQANILNNPSFERPYNSGAANGWGRFHENFNVSPKPENCSAAYGVLPVWSEESASGELILDGSIAQHIGNQFDTWHAAVVQDVNVNPGSTYRFSFWSRGRASNEQYPAPSDTSVNLRVQARIDPTGTGQWNSASVVRGAEGSPHDTWQQFSVQATATGNKITVAAAANLTGANNCRAHLDVWFDKAELVAVGPPPTNTPVPQPTSPPPPPPPPATATPIPSPTAVPTDTPVPSPTPIPPTATPAGGTICINTFNDANANGQNDDGAGYMAGVRYTIAQGSAVVAEGVSPGTDTPVCFAGLAAGQYDVAQTLPAALEMTTASNTIISVEQGKTIGLEFGSRIKPPPTATVAIASSGEDGPAAGGEDQPVTVSEPQDSPVTEEGGLAAAGIGLWELAALVVMIVAVILLAVVVILLVRRGL